MKARAWTVGYEGLTVEGLLEALQGARIEMLVDVRERPQSRKPGFSNRALSQRSKEAGLRYVHLGALGSPQRAREAFRKTANFAALRRAYLSHLEDQAGALERLKGLIAASPCALLCYEQEPAECHRAILCGELEKDGYAFTHLRPAPPAKPARSSGAKLSDFA